MTIFPRYGICIYRYINTTIYVYINMVQCMDILTR
nr:MAG TPA: hypothetical protein [Caudoviricetes sp.]